MLKTVLILSVLGSVSAQATTLSCPDSYELGLTCENTKKALKDYTQPQVDADNLVLCRRNEDGHFALVLNKAPEAGIASTLYTDGQGFGRNGFDVFTENPTDKKGVMLLPWKDSLIRIFVVNGAQPTAASEFNCQ